MTRNGQNPKPVQPGLLKFPSGLLPAAKVEEKLNGVMSADRINELADAGYMPHWIIDERRFFRMQEVKQYIARHLVTIVPATRFPKVLIVTNHAPANGFVDLPSSLEALGRNLRPMPRALASCGVYFLCQKREVVYVGQSTNVVARVYQHTGVKDFDSAYYLPVPATDLDNVEAAFIRALRPCLNGHGPIGTIEDDQSIIEAFHEMPQTEGHNATRQERETSQQTGRITDRA